MMQLADDNQCLGMQVALLLSTLQVVWSLPDPKKMLCSPRDTSTAGLIARTPRVGNPNWKSRPYSASPWSPTDRRTVWSSAEQAASMQVHLIPYTSSLVVQMNKENSIVLGCVMLNVPFLLVTGQVLKSLLHDASMDRAYLLYFT